MKAIVQDRYGPPDVLALREVERPVVGDHDALVRVRAASVNPADWIFLTGVPYIVRAASGLRRPRAPIPGHDLAGHVEAVGARVESLRPGDEVFGEVACGAFAEYVSAPEAALAPVPSNLTFGQAAAVPMAACTALQGLRDKGAVGSGQRVLVNGASGGVGTFAVQIARWLGAEVTGVCSGRNADLVRSLGAAHVVDYTRTDFTRSAERYDVLLDLVGNHSPARCRRALTPSGTYLGSAGRVAGRWLGPVKHLLRVAVLSPFVRQRMIVYEAKANRRDLVELTGLLEAGTLTPVVDRTYPLSEVPEALRYVGTQRARGKVVIEI